MKLMTVAGELSGDAHGGGILPHLNRLIPGLRIVGIGGEKMEEAGLRSIVSIADLQARGIVEVLRHIPGHYFLLRRMEAFLDKEKPDAILLIDYPGFNLRLAKAAKKRGIPVLYYSSPQLWAWRGGRIRDVAASVEKIIVLFPFEVPIYLEAGVDVQFLGHPLVGIEALPEQVEELRENAIRDPESPVVGIMPGSRPGEIQRHLPALLEGIRLIDQTGFKANYILPIAMTLDREKIEEQIKASGVRISLVEEGFLPLLKLADFAIVASGTATLQVCMAGIPFFAIYRVSPITFQIAKRFAYVKYISIVNILAGREVVPEVLQDDLTPENIRDVFLEIAQDSNRQTQMKQDLAEITATLGKPGAYQRAAEVIAEFLKEKNPSKPTP